MKGYHSRLEQQYKASWEQARVIAYQMSGSKKDITRYMPFPWEKKRKISATSLENMLKSSGLLIDEKIRKLSGKNG